MLDVQRDQEVVNGRLAPLQKFDTVLKIPNGLEEKREIKILPISSLNVVMVQGWSPGGLLAHRDIGIFPPG